jgi:hypothetical protein
MVNQEVNSTWRRDPVVKVFEYKKLLNFLNLEGDLTSSEPPQAFRGRKLKTVDGEKDGLLQLVFFRLLTSRG